MNYIYLKDEKYYIDRYDLLTIESCLRWIEILKGRILKDREEINTFKLADAKGFVGALSEFTLYFKKGEEYRDKEKTINRWKEDDRVKQEKYDNAREPDNVFCDHCNYAMKMMDKSLHESWKESSRVLFFFECPNCHKRKGIYEGGEVYDTRRKCPKCGSFLESTSTKKGEVLTTKENCKNCGYKYKDVLDFEAEDKRFKVEEERKKYLLDNFRNEFCLTKEEGDRYIEHQAGMDRLTKMMKEEKQKDEDPKYQKARALKKVIVFEMEKMLKEALEKEKYIELSFDKPEITKDVVIPFSVQESDSSRSDYDSQNNLKKLIKKILEDTNWRLMSDGINQRLGILTGRLRGYENEEDLVKIIKI